MKKRALKKTFKSCLNILLAAVLAVGSFSAAFVSKNVGADTVAEAANSYTLDQLYSEISEFESMMDGTTIYTNMSAAYTAYKTACEVYYENLYGYDYETGATTVAYSQDTVNSAYTALQTAIVNMSVFTGYVGTATAAADGSYSSSSLYSGTYPSSVLGGGSTSSGDKMSGLLYTYGVGSTSGWFGASWNKVSNSNTRLGNAYNYNNNHGLRYGTVVFLYTGTGHSSGGNNYNETSTYAVPINAYFSPGASKAVHFLSVNTSDLTSSDVLNNGNFDLKTAWHGIKSSTNSTSAWTDTTGYNSTLSTYSGSQSFQYLNQSYTAYNNNTSALYWSAYNATNYDYVVHTYSTSLYYTGNPSNTSTIDSTNESATAYYAKYPMISYWTQSGSTYSSTYPYFCFWPSESAGYVYYTYSTTSNPTKPTTTTTTYYSMYTGGGDSYQTGDAASYIYVLNYNLVLTALEDNKSALAMNGGSDGVTYYRQDKNGAMTALLAAFDAITAYDPNSAFSSNTTSLGVSSLVATAASTLSGYVTTLNSAATTAATNYDTITYTIKQVYQTASDPLDFTDASGNMVTSANSNDFASYTSLSYDKTDTVKGTVGVYFQDSVYSTEANGFIGNRLNSNDTVAATGQSAVNTLAGYSFSPNATAEYYKQVASHTLTTGQYSSINEYSKATVTNTWQENVNSSSIQRGEIHVVPYAQNVTFYSFYTANLIEIKVNYVDADDKTTVLKTENITIPYTTLTDTVDSGFVHQTTNGYSKYVLLSDGGENNSGETISDAVSSTYTSYTENSETEQTYTWLSSIAQQTTTYNSKETYTSITAAENAVQRTVSTDYVTTVYYRPLQVTVNYSVVSGTEIEDMSYGTLTLTGQSNTDATATETVTDTGTLTGSTVTVNQSQGNATYSLDGWYYSTVEITDASAFSTMSAYSTDEAVALALTETDVEDWTEDQTIYLYALLSMASTYTTLTVPIHVQDGQEGDVVVVKIADSSEQDYGTAVTLDSGGNATAVFTVYDGDYYVWVDTDWGYDIDIAIVGDSNASVSNPYQITVNNATTMDAIQITKITSPTGNSAEDIATNDFYGYISG